LEIPEYTREEFTEIALVRLKKENIDESLAMVIADRVWSELSKDVRDVIKVGRLASSSEEVCFVVKMLKKTTPK
jgi:hypothetical protein